MPVFLYGPVFGLCRCFDSLPHLLDQCMCLPVLLVDHLQSSSQLCQQRVVFLGGRFLSVLHSGQLDLFAYVFEQLYNLPLRVFRGFYQPLDPFGLGIV